jgi:DNA polymerase III subunit beta
MRPGVLPALQAWKGCTLMATDLELGIRLDVRGVKVEEPGQALLPCGRLLAILRETTDEEMTVEGDSEKVVVRGFTSEFDMPGEDVSAFPDVPAFAETNYHEINAGVLREMIRRTVFAASTETVRYGATTGVLWELTDDQATLVATDGRRLAVMRGPAKACGGRSTKDRKAPPVVPCKAMNLLARNLTDPDEVVRVSFRENDVLMQTGQTVIYSRFVEGRFPAYQQVIPKSHVHSVPLAAGPLLNAIRQASIMTDESVRFRFAKQKLTLQAKGAGPGVAYTPDALTLRSQFSELSCRGNCL